MTSRNLDGPFAGRSAASRLWGWLTLLSLVAAIGSTVLLGSMLAERRRDARYVQPTIVQPPAAKPASLERGVPNGSEPSPGTAASAAATTEAAGAASVRPRPYSSTDTETLAVARAYPNAVVAQPAHDSIDTTASPVRTRDEPLRDATAVVGADAGSPVEQTPPRRERRAVATAPDVGSTRKLPRVAVAEPPPAFTPSRLDVSPVAMPSIEPPARAETRIAPDLDDVWERREQWLRERLQQPRAVTR